MTRSETKNEANDNTPSDGRGEFFAVDSAMWAKVCGRGSMNEAVAYLVLARGSNFRTRTSPWSVDAIERYTGIARNRAKTALETLIIFGHVVRRRGGTKPLYHLPTARQLEEMLKPAEDLLEEERMVLDIVERLRGVVRIADDDPADDVPVDDAFWPAQREATAEQLVRKGKLLRRDDQEYALPPPEAAPVSDWIWLPNSLVDGVDGRLAPVEQVRQTQDLLALRLLVDLYFSQSLAFNGGLHWQMIREEYEKVRVGESGPFVVWGFRTAGAVLWHTAPFVVPHLTGEVMVGEAPDGSTSENDPGIAMVWKALTKLKGLGLIQFVGHLIDADTSEGEVIHPCPTSGGEPEERAIATAASAAAHRLITDEQARWAEGKGLDQLIPLFRHMENAQVIGLLRLTHRARTAATANWLKNTGDWIECASRYEEIDEKAKSGQRHATSRVHPR